MCEVIDNTFFRFFSIKEFLYWTLASCTTAISTSVWGFDRILNLQDISHGIPHPLTAKPMSYIMREYHAKNMQPWHKTEDMMALTLSINSNV